MPRLSEQSAIHFLSVCRFSLFFFKHPPTTEIYTLSLHDALPIYLALGPCGVGREMRAAAESKPTKGSAWPSLFYKICRSEEHTSELQSHSDLVCRLLLEKKKKKKSQYKQLKNNIRAEERQLEVNS